MSTQNSSGATLTFFHSVIPKWTERAEKLATEILFICWSGLTRKLLQLSWPLSECPMIGSPYPPIGPTRAFRPHPNLRLSLPIWHVQISGLLLWIIWPLKTVELWFVLFHLFPSYWVDLNRVSFMKQYLLYQDSSFSVWIKNAGCSTVEPIVEDLNLYFRLLAFDHIIRSPNTASGKDSS